MRGKVGINTASRFANSDLISKSEKPLNNRPKQQELDGLLAEDRSYGPL